MACILIFAGFGLSSADQARAQKVLEVRGGLHLSDVSEYAFETQFKRGIMLGAYYRELAALGPLTLQPGLDFIQKGFEEDAYSLTVNYLDFSLLLRFSLDAGFARPFVKAGPYLGYALSATEQIGDRQDGQEVNDFDYGGVVEGGFTINSLILGARASYGFAPIRDAVSSEPKNFTVGLYVGFSL